MNPNKQTTEKLNLTQSKERRDRIRRLLVCVSPTERAAIERFAHISGLSVSGYLRAAGLNHKIQSAYDYHAVRDMVGVAGDLGRLGGLLKLWLTERKGEGASVPDVNRVLKDALSLQDKLRVAIARV